MGSDTHSGNLRFAIGIHKHVSARTSSAQTSYDTKNAKGTHAGTPRSRPPCSQMKVRNGRPLGKTISNLRYFDKALDADGMRFRALITDVDLGSKKLTGWDVARRAREINDRIPVLYMTGADGHEWASMGVPNSVLITKPFAPAQVVTAVSQLINDASSAPS
jgi:CheY-like chemotaxis protein